MVALTEEPTQSLSVRPSLDVMQLRTSENALARQINISKGGVTANAGATTRVKTEHDLMVYAAVSLQRKCLLLSLAL